MSIKKRTAEDYLLSVYRLDLFLPSNFLNFIFFLLYNKKLMKLYDTNMDNCIQILNLYEQICNSSMSK